MTEQLAPVAPTSADADAEAAPDAETAPAVAPTEASADVADTYNDRQAWEQYVSANPFKRAAMYDKNEAAIERGRVASQAPTSAPRGPRPNPFKEAQSRLAEMYKDTK